MYILPYNFHKIKFHIEGIDQLTGCMGQLTRKVPKMPKLVSTRTIDIACQMQKAIDITFKAQKVIDITFKAQKAIDRTFKVQKAIDRTFKVEKMIDAEWELEQQKAQRVIKFQSFNPEFAHTFPVEKPQSTNPESPPQAEKPQNTNSEFPKKPRIGFV